MYIMTHGYAIYLFAIYIDDLSVCLSQCKAGCHLNETVTGHVMYADDICLMEPSTIIIINHNHLY